MNLQDTCEKAAALGRTIDISGCHYGLHKGTGRYFEETPYYSFLAGFVRLLDLKKVLEIGTYCGGSIMAISRALRTDDPDACLVTMDKTRLNEEGFRAYPRIHRILGDSLNAEVVKQTLALFQPPIDLLYIDSKHSYEHVSGNIRLYALPLAPRFIILDDIHHSESMEQIWAEICQKHPTSDISKLVLRDCGFGVVAYNTQNGSH
jgi:hypothetical protein